MDKIKKYIKNFLIFISKIFSIFFFGVIFFFLITPIGLIIRLTKKDLLNYKFNKEKSYWIKKSNYKINMKKQF